jgi:hypothetical protein
LVSPATTWRPGNIDHITLLMGNSVSQVVAIAYAICSQERYRREK